MTYRNQDSCCPTEEALAAFAEGALGGRDREAVEAHLADCADCRATVLAVVAAVGREGADRAPAGLSDRVLARLPLNEVQGRAPRPEGTMGRVLSSPWAAISAAAVVILAITVALPGASARGSRVLGGDWPATLPAAAKAGEREVSAPPRPLDLGGNDRYLAHLQTDKPLYRPGERVFARAVVLGAFDRRPIATPAVAVFDVKSAKGELVARAMGNVENGVASFGWAVPLDALGGTYTLATTFPWSGFPESEMTFDVRDYRVPRLNTDLQFAKKAYGPGDLASATLSVARAEGGIPKGAKFTAVATVDGVEAYRKDGLLLDEEGKARFSFPLPKSIQVGDGTLALSIEDGGVVETAAKTIPILVNRVLLTFLPEGGDLVADVPCRVYFEARTPKQAPADVAGEIVDGDGREVAHFDSFHEGRGTVGWTPRAFTRYFARVERPAGIGETFALPGVLLSGISLSSRQPAFGPEEAVRVGIAASVTTNASVGLYLKERELAVERVRLFGGEPVEVTLTPREAAAGVLRVTVFDELGVPRAERLVYRKPPTSVRIEVTTDVKELDPAGRVNVTVRTTDPLGRPVPAVVGVSAVDDSVLETIDTRERAPRLPTAVLLGADVKELKDAHLYLDDDADSARRTDLLLGTQGWRRFGFTNADDFAQREGAMAERALARRVLLPGLPSGGALDPTAGTYFNDGFDDDFAARAERVFDATLLLKAEGKRHPMVRQLKPVSFFLVQAAREGAAAARISEFRPFHIARIRVGGDMRVRLGEAALAGRLFTVDPVVAWARQFAHEVPASRPPELRTDFTETLFWNAALLTDDKGTATFGFNASDAITTVRVRADGFTKDGALGISDATVTVRRALYVEPKFPVEVTAGDRIDLPVSISNGTAFPARVSLTAEVGDALRLVDASAREVEVPAKGSARVVLSMEGLAKVGTAKVRLRARAGTSSDEVVREIRVAPAGFPIAKDFGGILESQGNVAHPVEIPGEVAPGSLAVQATVYPTPLATLAKALEALLREPGGCFEQTSSSNYPNVMVLQYLRSHQGADPAVALRAAEMLERGYRKLVSFECKKEGYEWFGGDPGHEALTAYGLLEFTDMAQVMSVDAQMLGRTRAWLLSRRDGKGGFQKNDRALDSFGRAPKDVTDAYIAWALVEAGEKGLDPEVAAVKAAALQSKDPYVTALAANLLARLGDREAAATLCSRLASLQAKDGSVPGAATSITCSSGDALAVETTSLSILAWLADPARTANVETAMRWLSTRCQDGKFSSTQATVLALRAVVAYDAARAKTRADGVVRLLVDGQVAETLPFKAGDAGPLAFKDLGSRLGAGAHTLSLAMEGGSAMPYSLAVRYHAMTPASSVAAKVEVVTEFTRAEAKEGDPVDVALVVRNRTDGVVSMPVAIVGLPGGVEARADALKELVREGKVDAFETRGREVILYWRGLRANESRSVLLPCLATVPGSFTGPASRAYPYYGDEDKSWAKGLSLSISAR